MEQKNWEDAKTHLLSILLFLIDKVRKCIIIQSKHNQLLA